MTSPISHMKRGSLWLLGGFTISLLTYAAAAQRGGGAYLVASGAIFWGVAEFLYGLFLFSFSQSGRQPSVQTTAISKSENWRPYIPPEAKEPKRSSPPILPKDLATKWSALVKYDADVAAAAKRMLPYGEEWSLRLAQDYFALEEKKEYLSIIVSKLSAEAEQEHSSRSADQYKRLYGNEVCTEESLSVLRLAESSGYTLTVADNRTIAATKAGTGTSYFRSNSDIQRFGKFL